MARDVLLEDQSILKSRGRISLCPGIGDVQTSGGVRSDKGVWKQRKSTESRQTSSASNYSKGSSNITKQVRLCEVGNVSGRSRNSQFLGVS